MDIYLESVGTLEYLNTPQKIGIMFVVPKKIILKSCQMEVKLMMYSGMDGMYRKNNSIVELFTQHSNDYLQLHLPTHF